MRYTGLKRGLLFLVTGIVMAGGCSKDEKHLYSGTATIDNRIYGSAVYYAIGFSFDEGKLLPTNKLPAPDITVHAHTGAGGVVTGAYLDTPVLVAPYALAGEFDTSQEAEVFYDNLGEVGVPAWVSTADPVSENQVWLFRTPGGNYAKFRVISLLLDDSSGVYAEMRFEWKVQPDGSTIFR